MDEPKIELSAEQFIHALQFNIATDINGRNHRFTGAEIRNVFVDDYVTINDLVINNRIKLKDCNLNGLAFFDSVFEDYLYIESCKIKTLEMTNSTFSSFAVFHSTINWFSILNGEVHKDLMITNTKITEGLFLEGLKANTNIMLLALTVTPKIDIKQIKVKKNLNISRSVIHGDLTLGNNCVIDGNMHLGYSSIDGSYSVSNFQSSRMEVLKTTVNDIISIDDECTFEYFNIDETVFSKKVSIRNSSLKLFKLHSIPEKMSMNISSIDFQRINIQDGFSNLGYMQWHNLYPNKYSQIEILTSIMGKWDIVSCDFSKINMVIYSSKITDAFYTNSKFPDELSLPEKISDKENPHDILSDGYNQLKTIAQKQNDRKVFLHFQAAELKSYFNSISICRNPFTKIQLAFLWASSNFGTSWVQGIIFTLICNLIFLTLLLKDWDLDCFRHEPNYLNQYVDFLISAFNKPSFVITGYENLIYLLDKIFVTFGIYQTIAAFRKFGKSE
jgi:hypothetical protein